MTRIVCLRLPTLFALALLSVSYVSAEEFSNLLANDSLDAWRGYNQQEVPDGWKLRDGVLTMEGGSGDLLTREQYGDFDLHFEWRVDKGANSGVMYRVTETTGPAYKTGPEYQVLDDESWRKRSHDNQLAGSLYGLYTRGHDATKPAGEWNQARIVIQDGHVEHWLNGVKVVEARMGSDDWNERVANSKFAKWVGFGKNARGHFVLQDHGGGAAFRNIRIQDLDKPATSKSDSSHSLRVLLVTQSGGYRHSTVTRKLSELSHCERVMKELGVKSGEFRVDCTQDVEQDFKPELIENYDIVMFYTSGAMYDASHILPIPSETLDWFLSDWLRKEGNGFLGVHAATDTFKDYEPYWEMIGGTFNGHPWNANSTVTITVHDKDHPVTQPWGAAEFSITDEIYQFNHWQPEKARVLMSLNMEKTAIKKPYHVPVCWVKQYGEGRVMYLSLGHREDVWSNSKYQQSLLNGIRWLVGRVEGDAAPNPEISAEQDRLAKQVVERLRAL